MSVTKQVFNAFYDQLSILQHNGSLVKKVKKTNAEIVDQDEYPCIEVLIGQDTRSEHTSLLFEHDLTVYTDIHIKYIDEYRSDSNSIDDEMLEIRDLIESAVITPENLNLDFVFLVKLIGQSQPIYNEPGAEFASSTRLEFLINYEVKR